eukprot:365817-Chlamydomonas_euryale.AAC.34
MVPNLGSHRDRHNMHRHRGVMWRTHKGALLMREAPGSLSLRKVCVGVTSLVAEPPPAQWIRRGQPDHTPPQGPQAVEKEGRTLKRPERPGQGVDSGPNPRCLPFPSAPGGR